MIPYNDFVRLIAGIPDCDDLEDYIAEEGGSVPLDGVEQVTSLLTTLWTMRRDGLTIKSIAAAAGMSCRAIAMEHGISYRTLAKWATGESNATTWQLLMIAYAVLSDLDT